MMANVAALSLTNTPRADVSNHWKNANNIAARSYGAAWQPAAQSTKGGLSAPQSNQSYAMNRPVMMTPAQSVSDNAPAIRMRRGGLGSRSHVCAAATILR